MLNVVALEVSWVAFGAHFEVLLEVPTQEAGFLKHHQKQIKKQ